MKSLTKSFLLWVSVALAATMFAQTAPAPMYPNDSHPSQAPNPDQDRAPQEMNQNTGQNATTQNDMPVFRVTVTERTTKAVNYRHRGGSTEVGFSRHRTDAGSGWACKG